jgi:thymidine kinase
MSKLYFRYGAMGSGKTASLLQVAHNYEQKNMNVILIKPAIDTKAEDKVSSRIGIERYVDILLNSTDKIIDEIGSFPKPDAIIIDEAQFLTTAQVDELYLLTKFYDVPILCYGLRCDFKMQPFEGSSRLLQIADDIEELKTVCRCGAKATQNLRLINDEPVFEGEQVEIDNHTKVEYEGVCGKCYLKLRKSF